MNAVPNKEPELKRDGHPWIIAVGIMLFSILFGSTVGYLYENIYLGIFLVTAGLIILALAVLPQKVTNYLLAVYIFVFVAAYDFAGYDPILTVPIKIYYADGILLFMVVFLLHLLFHRISILDLRSPITLLLIGNLIYGFMAVIIGRTAGNSTNNILGDFRRFFLYPLVTFLPLLIKIKWKNVQMLFKWFCLSLTIISVIALFRVFVNTSWDPEQFSATNQFRAIGYFSGILLCIGVGILYAVFLNNRYQKKIITIVLLFLFETAIFASGYRMLWILGVFLPLFITYFSSRGLGKLFKILGITAVVLIFTLAATYLIKNISPDVYDRLVNRLFSTVRDLDFRNNIRFYAWKSAWSMFITAPILGVGIGDQFEFISLNSGGQYYISHLTTHNILVSLLYQTGIIGAGLFIGIHGVFTMVIWRGLSILKPYNRILMLGMLAGYFSALIMGMVQPSFESPGAIVIFYFFVGIILNIFRMFTSNLHA